MAGDGKIEFVRATIHFIYSFLPRLEEDQIVLQEKDFKRLYKSCGKPDNRKGITPYLDLDLEMGFVQFPDYTGSLNDMAIIVKPMVRLFPLGSTCCLSIHASKKGGARLSTDDIHSLLCLVRQKQGMSPSPKVIHVENEEKSIYDVFQHILKQLVDKANAGHEQEGKLSIMCNDHLLKTDPEPQTPWVVTVLELTEPAHKAFCDSFSNADSPLLAKSKAISAFEQDIAPILFRSVTGSDFQVEPAYIRSAYLEQRPGIYNMNVDARLFVHISRRSILCLCDRQKEDPAAYFIPVLLDLCEITRARWHALILMNKIMDESLKNFRSGEGTTPKQRLERIISLSDRFATCLEDPGTFVCSGDALREIHERLKDTFRIKDLAEVILRKLDMLERLYRHGLEMRWAEKF